MLAKGRKRWLIFLPLAILIIYLIGPRPASSGYDPSIPVFNTSLPQLEEAIRNKENMHRIKKDNEARIIWANDSIRQQTEFSIVYLHGFSASQAEGEPIHRNLAKKFGCNLYLSRLAEHGIDTTDQLINLNPDKYWSSAKEAFAIGRQIGKRVILIGTSTGGTLALMLAASQRDIAGLILLSPNIEINDPNAWLLNTPWGLHIARSVTGSKYIYSSDTSALHKQYWNYPYRLEAAVQLQEMLETAMTEDTYRRVTQPLLMLYYYRDELHQDNVVKVSAMLNMFNQLGTAPHLKKAIAIPTAGHHVIGSYIKSKDIQTVEEKMAEFLVSLGL